MIDEALNKCAEHEPNLYKAAVHIFGKSYEYTAKYRAFVKEIKAGVPYLLTTMLLRSQKERDSDVRS